MKKTLVLCFIHGFKGGEETFGADYQFTRDLRDAVAHKLPKVDVRVLVYPKYETRGDLGQLEEKVIDLEVAAGTPSPTVDPSVRTILIGHSMGGIVAAEMVIALASEKPIYSEDGIQKNDDGGSSGGKPFNALMFPYVQGVLAFDTPYLGISPGVVAHGAEGQYQNYQAAAATLSQLSGLGAVSGGRLARPPAAQALARLRPSQHRPSPSSSSSSQWGKWGKVAMFAGAAGAVAAGGAAAWANRDQITTGWTWASSHLEFVGSLARPEELKKRVRGMVRLSEELDVGFANLYTRLGKAAPSKTVSMVGTVLGPDRTFCNLPKKMDAGGVARGRMFEPGENPAYEALADNAAGLIEGWLQNEWYETSTQRVGQGSSKEFGEMRLENAWA
ncbi:hypothetical protein ACCO45_001590 [Purpureocillium lilacinum]|uniref:Uncharacterized protein n=1 Tax=Purpureocillium lilacinum TaxID=33203 RepID=A0ACC4EAA4_PURLI